MKMNYTDALTLAIDTLTDIVDINGAEHPDKERNEKAITKLSALRNTYEKRNENRPVMSEEKKTELANKRKAENAAKRAELMEKVLPVNRKTVTGDMTAKEIYEKAAAELPKDFNPYKVQWILLHEMADEVVKTEAKGKPNTYKMKG
jgi:hypothetical protein